MTTTDGRMLDAGAVLGAFRELGGIGTVELKMNVPSEQRLALRALRVDPLQGKLREVVFFDTPALDLFNAGVIVRGRRTQGRDDDTVVKLRPVVADELPDEVRGSPNLKIELDITRDSYVVSASMKGVRPPGTVQETVAGTRTVDRLLTKEQRRFLADRLPAGSTVDRLVPLGPVYVVVVKAVPEGLGRKLTAEQWHFPGQVPLVELSTKAQPGEVTAVHREATEFLRRCGLSPVGEQQPKTRTALEFFAALTT